MGITPRSVQQETSAADQALAPVSGPAAVEARLRSLQPRARRLGALLGIAGALAGLAVPLSAEADDIAGHVPGAPPAPVCLIDSGAPALAQVISAEAVDGGSGADNKGHGSDMAATMVATWPSVRIRSVRVTDAYGRLTPSQFAQGVRMCMAHPDVQVVVSASTWPGRPAGAENVDAALSELAASGRSFVVSAGNAGTLEFPAGRPGAITVGAIDETGELCDFSPRGQGVSVYADGCLDGEQVWGTSPAAAEAATVLSAIRAARGDLSREQAEAMLTAAPKLSAQQALARIGVRAPTAAQDPDSARSNRAAKLVARPKLRAAAKVTRTRTTLKLANRPVGAKVIVRVGAKRISVRSSTIVLRARGQRRARKVTVTLRYVTADGRSSRQATVRVTRF